MNQLAASGLLLLAWASMAAHAQDAGKATTVTGVVSVRSVEPEYVNWSAGMAVEVP